MKDKKNILGINKQLSSSSTTKLAVLSTMLLLAVFCTIGMSFTPAEEGENVGNPNDSTYVTGPRRSHWTTTSTTCTGQTSTTNHNETDYARVKAVVKIYDETNTEISSPNIGQVTLENISTTDEKGTVEDGSPSNETTSAYINWNSSKGANGDADGSVTIATIAAAHKLKVKFTAECINEGYNFVGWYKAEGMSDSDFKDGRPIFEETICIGGGNEPGTGYGSYANGEENKKTTYTTGNRYTVTYYACFRPKTKVTVTLRAAENGSYTYADGTNSGTITSTDGSIETKSVVTLQASPATGYKFFGWYEIKDGKETYFSYESSTEKTFPTDATIYAKFIPANWATYIVINKPEVQYYDFQAAADAADASTDKVFLPLINGVVPAGNYTIPRDVTLLVPYNDAYTVEKENHNYLEAPAVSGRKVSPYRTLTLDSGVTINVNGDMVVGAQYYSSNGTNPGGVCAKYGFILMNEGSLINLNVSAKLYAWGYISGDGQIIAAGSADGSSGANLYEMFQITDFRGGNATVTKYATALGEGYQNKVFPILSYYMQNIEVPLTLEYGANLSVDYGLYMADNHFTGRNYFIGSNSSAMFSMKSGEITRWYDRMTDRIHYELNGNCDLKNISIKANYLITYTINSKDYTLPINSNMTINVKSGSKFNLTQDMSFLPCTDITIEKGATMNVGEGLNVYTYDAKDWVGRGCVMPSFDFEQLLHVGRNDKGTYGKPFVRTMGADNPNHDARLKINGEMILNGYLYTSSFGANICSDGGGKIIYKKSAGTKTEIWQGKNTEDFQQIPITAALLHNDEEMNPTEPYTQTKGAVAGDEFWYVESLGKWVKNEFGPELDIVDADNTEKSLTINANGWASSGWPYTINGTEYGKDDKAEKEKYRQADRTLVIPYTGTSGASLPIAVLDKDGKPICRHIYKVPFVYTGTEDMSAMNENSIVFVKSGTLTIEDNISTKEIYVAPGAELEVTGTLTVGKLVLRTTPWQSAVLTNNGTINGQVYYSRISPDSKQYYQFGLPLSCELDDVKMSNTDKLGGSQPKYGTAWILKSYNENKRANNGISSEGANWEILESEGTITAGVGYEMFSNSNYYREFYFPVTLPAESTTVSVSYTSNGAEGAAHAGWNIITSPLTSKATVTIGDPATAIKVCWLQADGTYKQEQPTVIPPAIPFSYQASKGEDNLNFAVPTIAAAPRKQSAAEALTETEWVHLDIFDAYGEGDETSLFVHPTRFEQTYKTGIDVAKQSLTASRSILYSTHAYGDMAFAGIADSLLEDGIDLAIYSPAEQKLTFSLRKNKFLNRLEYLWLADNKTGARTDLLMDDYTCRADAGTIKGRFVLNGRFKAPQIATGIDNTQTDYNIYAIGNNIAISGVEQGTPIYVFDAVGHMIYTTAATSDEVIAPAPCAGVYMLSVGGQTAKLVINQ